MRENNKLFRIGKATNAQTNTHFKSKMTLKTTWDEQRIASGGNNNNKINGKKANILSFVMNLMRSMRILWQLIPEVDVQNTRYAVEYYSRFHSFDVVNIVKMLLWLNVFHLVAHGKWQMFELNVIWMPFKNKFSFIYYNHCHHHHHHQCWTFIREQWKHYLTYLSARLIKFVRFKCKLENVLNWCHPYNFVNEWLWMNECGPSITSKIGNQFSVTKGLSWRLRNQLSLAKGLVAFQSCSHWGA